MSSLAIRLRDRNIFETIKKTGEQSIRKLAKLCGISKDKVQRSIWAQTTRNIHPESEFWETHAGGEWLQRLIMASVLVFALKGNVGAERLSEFFHLVRLEKHLGVSPTALRNLIARTEPAIIKYGETMETQLEGKTIFEIVAGGDETFFHELTVLIMMDLPSGYIIVEETASDRSYETWQEKTPQRLKKLGLRVRHFRSVRGKSLMKLALDSLGCQAGADLFHGQRDISKWEGNGFFSKLGKATKAVKNASQKLEVALEVAKKKGSAKSKLVATAKLRLEQEPAQQYKLERGKEKYQPAQPTISEAIHPWSKQNNKAQSSRQAEKCLEQQVVKFKEIGDIHNIPDHRGMLDKFQRQIKDIASNVGAWWTWALKSVESLGLNDIQQTWVLCTLLPVIYWQLQVEKTKSPEMKQIYQSAYEKALSFLSTKFHNSKFFRIRN